MTAPISIDEARRLTRAALGASGCLPAQAASIAEALVEAEIAGQFGHGLSRIPAYCAQARNRKCDGTVTPEAVRLTPGLMRVDAKNGFAYPAWDIALEALPGMAAEAGIAAACIVHSGHFGVAGLHAERLAEAGCVALVFGNATACMAPWGGATPLYGTNPIGFAAPVPGKAPLVIDMATSVVAKGKMVALKQKGETHVPEGWALDRDGRPVTEIDAALAGTVAPMGGAKGAALALMVEVLSACLCAGALSREASSLLNGEGPPPDIAQLVIAVDAGIASGGAYGERIGALMALFDQIEGARAPGMRRLAAREKAAAEGILVSPGLRADIDAIIAGNPPPETGIA